MGSRNDCAIHTASTVFFWPSDCPPAGGQSLGQKNTVLAVWMAQSFLDPISSIAPTAYIVWQNFVNSYQIYRHDQRKSD